jgi:RHS repeat-associated protein
MKRKSLIRTLAVAFFVGFAAIAALAQPQEGSLVNVATPAAGQSTTLLPDGNLLLVGGFGPDGRPLADVVVFDVQRNELRSHAMLSFPRSWHTATVLPDGTVLILGGIGADSLVAAETEIFDPASGTVQTLGSGAPLPRVFHSATLLTDGRVLIAGGAGPDGSLAGNAELWDPRQKTSSNGALLQGGPRRNHQATLLADGRVLLSGGTGDTGKLPPSDAVFDPQSQVFSSVPAGRLAPPANGGAGQTTVFSPEDGAVDVPLTALLSMRFSRPVQMQSVNVQTVVLSGPFGIVDARVVGAERGMLGFVTPNAPLLPGTTYTLRLSGVMDAANAGVAFTEFTFTTAGEAAQSDLWVPTADWMIHGGTSRWQSLPPLQAPPGVVALAGQVLKLDGTPLARVTLRIGGRTAESDGTGRFLITGIPAGHDTMMIFADTANTPVRKYGVYEVGVDIQPGVTSVLPYTIWMTALDTVHAVHIPSPTTSETVVSSPLLPGLQLHLPPDTVITDSRGKVVTEITITPIPLDRPPFPLPHVPVPVYFTIQPGAAYIKVASASGPKGARLFYPNAHGYPPGTPFQFWNYDAATPKGWFIYGKGKVSPDRSQIIPDPGVEIYEFTGAMVSNPGNGPGDGPRPGNHDKNGEPVDLGTGLFVYNKVDLELPDVIPLVLKRTYRQNDPISRSFGIGASDPFDIFMVGDNNTFPEGYTFQDLILADGGRVHFPRTSPCTGANGYCDFTNAVYQSTTPGTDFYGAIVRFGSCFAGGSWSLTKKDGTVYCFPDSDASNNSRAAAPIAMRDRFGNTLTFTRDSSGNLTQVTSPNGRWMQFTYDANNRIIQAKDIIGRTVNYTYDAGGRLTRVTDANGGIWNYSYDAFNEMISIQDPKGVFYLTNQYDSAGRVVRQTQADNTNFLFSYTTDPITGAITQTDFTNPNGIVTRTAFNAAGYSTSQIAALGRPEQQTTSFGRDPNTNLLTSITDPLSRQTAYTFDSLGNITSITRLAGTPNAVTTTLTYEPTFNQLSSITDPLNHTTSLSYTPAGALSGITDPLGHQTTFVPNTEGLPVSITDPAGNTAQVSYDGADLVSITDPVGNITSRFIDSAGRLLALTDAAGRVTRYTFNALNQVVQSTDALQGVTVYTYDANGNVASVQDTRGGLSLFTYNNRDQLITRTDPMLRQESFAYDQAGNLVSATDRKGQVTTYQYDGLKRPVFIGFGTQMVGGNPTYASTISYTYDSVDRLTQAVDSLSGTITRSYDNLDHVASETTPLGSLSYSYDSAGRRTGMTVLGQPAVAYSYDDANRILQISQGTAVASLSYDNANRRTSLTLPNGVSVAYSYDRNSHVIGTTYSFGANTLGDLSYAYDSLGNVVQRGGSLTRTGLPQPVISAAYDAANELANWNGVPVSYDNNGNMLSDGTNTFAWDTRNHLSALNGNALQYDVYGRRTLNASGTGFLYDGLNAVQELAGSSVTANLLTLGIDEVFSRTDSTGSFSLLTDKLGSTLALSDVNGNMATSYTYDPFGVTTITGSSTNPYQFTGRENAGNGLYYYRARYYNSTLGRFISEDPAGFDGGDTNLYAYVLDNPTNYTDPSGKCIPCVIAAIGAGFGAVEGAIHGVECGDSGWKLAGDIARGAVSNGLGALAGFGAGIATDNPYIGGAAGGATSNIVDSVLQGKWPDPASVAVDAGQGALLGGLADGLIPEGPGRPIDKWNSPRTWGPKAINEYRKEGISDDLNTVTNLARKCGCD